jgi:hypothetical protein
MPLVYAGPAPDAARLSRIARAPSQPGRYRTPDGRPCPGVTGLLADLGLGVEYPAWLSRERLDHLAARGQRVHQLTAMALAFSKGLTALPSHDDMRAAGAGDTEVNPFLAAAATWAAHRIDLLDSCSPTRFRLEHAFVAEDARGRAAGGRVDLALGPVAAVRGTKLYLFDFKLYDLPARQGNPHALQLAGYAWGLRKALQLPPDCEVRRRIVSLRDDGSYRELRYEQWANQDDLTWRGALAGWYRRYRPDGTGGNDHGRYNVGGE